MEKFIWNIFVRMRKKLSLLIFLFCSQMMVNGQSLEGEWRGNFTQNWTYSVNNYEVIIELKKIDEKTYEGFSKSIITRSKNEFDTAICLVKGDFDRSGVLHLKEVIQIKGYKSDSGDSKTCLMTMDLNLYNHKKKKYLQLSGYWTTVQDLCGYGRISIAKSL